MAIGTLQTNNTEEKKKRELLHNQQQKQTFPYMTNPAQPLPVVNQQQQPMGGAGGFKYGMQPQQAPQPVQSTYSPAAGQQQVLQAGQKAVAEGFQSPTLDLASEKTQGLLQDPSMGFDPQKYKSQQMGEFNLGAAQAYSAAKKETAPIYGSGEARGDLADLNLRIQQSRSQRGGEIDQMLYEQKKEELYRSLAEGRETAESERQKFATNVGAITGVAGAMEGTEQRSFQGAENAIDRGMELATKTQDQGFQLALTELQGKIQSGLMLQEQDFKSTESALSHQRAMAMQSTDINAKKDYLETQLAFDKMKMEAGFEFTEEQGALNRGLELTLQSGDQKFQENMMNLKEKIDLNIMASDQDWKGIQGDLQRQADMAISQGNWDSADRLMKTQQEFQAIQSDLAKKHEETLQLRAFDQEKWKQGRTEELTKLGWSQEEAMQQTQIENDKFMQAFEWKKKELIQQGMQDFEAEQAAKQIAHQSSESNLERQLQREVENGRISLEEKRLMQDASQFKSKQEFDQWAVMKGIESQEADRLWQSGESAKDRAFDAQLQQIEQEFVMKGKKFNEVMAGLADANPEQAAATLKQMAVEAGLTYMENGEIKQGIKELDEEQMEDAMVENQMQSIRSKVDQGINLSEEEYETYKNTGSSPRIFDAQNKNEMFEYTYDARDSNKGKRAYRFKADAWNWVNSNKGKVIQDPYTGGLFMVEDFWEPGTSKNDKNKWGHVLLKSLKTGESFKWQGGPTVKQQEGTGYIYGNRG